MGQPAWVRTMVEQRLVPFDAGVQQAMALAGRTCRTRGDAQIGTGAVLDGVLAVCAPACDLGAGGPVVAGAAEVVAALRLCGLSVAHARLDLDRYVRDAAPRTLPAGAAGPLPLSPQMADVAQEAQRLARGRQQRGASILHEADAAVDVWDVFRALVECSGSLAAAVLRSWGVTEQLLLHAMTYARVERRASSGGAPASAGSSSADYPERAECAALREALAFYADPASWDVQWDRVGAAILHAHSAANDDRGDRARAALGMVNVAEERQQELRARVLESFRDGGHGDRG